MKTKNYKTLKGLVRATYLLFILGVFAYMIGSPHTLKEWKETINKVEE